MTFLAFSHRLEDGRLLPLGFQVCSDYSRQQECRRVCVWGAPWPHIAHLPDNNLACLIWSYYSTSVHKYLVCVCACVFLQNAEPVSSENRILSCPSAFRHQMFVLEKHAMGSRMRSAAENSLAVRANFEILHDALINFEIGKLCDSMTAQCHCHNQS